MITSHLDAIHWLSFFENWEGVGAMFNEFMECCTFPIRKFTPTSRSSTNFGTLRSHIQRLHSQPHESDDAPKIAKKIQRASRRLRVLTESNLDFKDARAFFKYANTRIGSKSSMSTLKDGVVVHSTPEDRANHLASHFETVFVDSAATHVPLPPVEILSPNIQFDVSEYATRSILLSPEASTNRTPDLIPQLFYEKFACFLAEPLSMIFSKSYRLGSAPELFRRTLVTPIFKKGEN